MGEFKYFFSYARKDKEFVLKASERITGCQRKSLAEPAGHYWRPAMGPRYEDALRACQGMIVVLSSEALASNNVMNEVSYALEEEKLVLPVRSLAPAIFHIVCAEYNI